MTDSIEGGCMCRQFRYQLHEAVKFVLHCQCRDCQRITGTGHAVLVGGSTASTTFSGTAARFTYQSDAGSEMRSHFCAGCGSPLYKTSSRYPDLLFFHAGSLDDPGRISPSRIVWARSAQPWDVMDPGLPAEI